MSESSQAPAVAQFYVWKNTRVALIALTADMGEYTLSYGGLTEEGYDHTVETYRLDSDYVVLEAYRRACDCDGRLDEHCEVRCHISRLQLRQAFDMDGTPYPMKFPEWERVSASQRDYSAEAMGY